LDTPFEFYDNVSLVILRQNYTKFCERIFTAEPNFNGVLVAVVTISKVVAVPFGNDGHKNAKEPRGTNMSEHLNIAKPFGMQLTTAETEAKQPLTGALKKRLIVAAGNPG
jgi:hypothetical protein